MAQLCSSPNCAGCAVDILWCVQHLGQGCVAAAVAAVVRHQKAIGWSPMSVRYSDRSSTDHSTVPIGAHHIEEYGRGATPVAV